MDGREQAQLANLADGDGESRGDRLFRPVLGGQAFDRPPQVDRRHRCANDIFAHRPHPILVVRILDQNVDFGKANLDGDADAPGGSKTGEYSFGAFGEFTSGAHTVSRLFMRS